jgi:sortase A
MLQKVGVVTMAFALVFAAGVALYALLDEPMESAIAAKPAAKASPSLEPLVRSYPPVKPRVERAEAPPESKPEPAPIPEPQAKPLPKPQPKPEPEPRPEPEREVLPVAWDDWPTPTEEQIESASQPRYYDLPPGAIMGLTIEALGVYDAPVFNSDSQWALDNGIAHVPETSLPWSNTPQRNVYLAGHRFGWPGTGSHLVFYNLDELGGGDKVVLRDREGRRYTYRVSEVFIAEPEDSWVMGQVRDRDMVTLQTCTPIPIFDKRLIVRADRV